MGQNANIESKKTSGSKKKGIDWYWIFTIILFVMCGLALGGIIFGLYYILEVRE